MIDWVIAIMALIGTVANIYKRRWCFYIWSVTNAYWIAYDYQIGAYAQAALFAVYLGLSLWGLWRWRIA